MLDPEIMKLNAELRSAKDQINKTEDKLIASQAKLAKAETELAEAEADLVELAPKVPGGCTMRPVPDEMHQALLDGSVGLHSAEASPIYPKWLNDYTEHNQSEVTFEPGEIVVHDYNYGKYDPPSHLPHLMLAKVANSLNLTSTIFVPSQGSPGYKLVSVKTKSLSKWDAPVPEVTKQVGCARTRCHLSQASNSIADVVQSLVTNVSH